MDPYEDSFLWKDRIWMNPAMKGLEDVVYCHREYQDPQAEAKKALIQFLVAYNKASCDKKLTSGLCNSHLCYLLPIMQLKNNLDREDYTEAGEIILHLFAARGLLTKKRVHINLLAVLKQHFHREEDDEGRRKIYAGQKRKGECTAEKLSFRYEYETAMEKGYSWFCEELPDKERKKQIQFLMDLFLRDIQSTSAAEFTDSHQDDGNGRNFPPLCTAKERIIKNVKDVRVIRNPVKGSNTHGAVFYPELNFCEVCDGNLCEEDGNGCGNEKIEAEVIHLSDAYDLTDTDGAFWIDRKTGEKLCPVLDFRMAVLYELARKRDAINLPLEEKTEREEIPLDAIHWKKEYRAYLWKVPPATAIKFVINPAINPAIDILLVAIVVCPQVLRFLFSVLIWEILGKLFGF